MRFFFFFLLCVTLSLFGRDLITPIPLTVEYDKQKALLGKTLFFDTRLSLDNTISCASCHQFDQGGADGLEVSVGVNGQLGKINAPTVLNSRFNIAQFWNGRAKNLEHQAFFPIHDPTEMAMGEGTIVQKLEKVEEYALRFSRLYPDGITMKNIQNAIAEFEKALITPESRFDKYLKGDFKALSSEEKEGYSLFKSIGCISCHNGVLLGGNFFQKVGIYEPYFVDGNLGLYEVTKKEEDKYYFKVPTLRNISQTAPYFHNGKIQTIQEAIQIMAYYQLGRELEKEKRDFILKFLLTLDGKKPEILDEQ